MTVAPPWSLRECHIQGKSPAWPRPPQTSLICGAMRQVGHYADSTSFVPAVRVVRRLSKADPSVTRQDFSSLLRHTADTTRRSLLISTQISIRAVWAGATSNADLRRSGTMFPALPFDDRRRNKQGGNGQTRVTRRGVCQPLPGRPRHGARSEAAALTLSRVLASLMNPVRGTSPAYQADDTTSFVASVFCRKANCDSQHVGRQTRRKNNTCIAS